MRMSGKGYNQDLTEMLAQHILRWNEGNPKISQRLRRRIRLKRGCVSVLFCVVLFCVFSGIIVDLSALKETCNKCL